MDIFIAVVLLITFFLPVVFGYAESRRRQARDCDLGEQVQHLLAINRRIEQLALQGEASRPMSDTSSGDEHGTAVKTDACGTHQEVVVGATTAAECEKGAAA